MHTRWFEDFTVGDRFETRGMSLTDSQIVDFAQAFDPQAMHVNVAAAEAGQFGGLIASGFHTLSLSFRLFLDLGLMERSNIVGAGLDEVRWLAPVRPGDTLMTTVEVLETRESRSKRDRGTLRLGLSVRNQQGEVVLTYQALPILRKRPADETG